MRVRETLHRWRCKWDGHSDHHIWQQSGVITCGRCGVVTSDYSRSIKGDVTVHLE